MITELFSLSVLQNERKREVDLESIDLSIIDIFKGMPLQNLNAFRMYLERIFKCHLNHI